MSKLSSCQQGKDDLIVICKAYHYELEPTAGQRRKFFQHVGTARFAYNWGLACKIEAYKVAGKNLSWVDLDLNLNAIKAAEFPWMSKTSSCVPTQAFRNLDKAYQNFYRRAKQNNGKPGFPRFKKKGVSRDSCRFTGTIKVLRRKVQLPRCGKIRTKEKTDKFRGRILNATLSRDTDRWFVSICVEAKIPNPKPIKGPVVGIDLGINSFAVLSDGTRLESPQALENGLKLFARRQRQHSRKEKGSANRKKSAMRLARLHRRIRNRRNDFLHKATTMLAKTKSAIVVEDLGVHNMMRNHSLARRIADAGWAEFRRQITYKTKWYGSKLIVADKFFPSSKTCNRCGCVKDKLTLTERTFICEDCGYEIDRDLNAAINLAGLALVRDTTGSFPGSYACGDRVRPARSREGSGQGSRNRALSVMTMS